MKPLSPFLFATRAAATGLLAFTLVASATVRADDVQVEMFAPRNGDQVGVNGFGWFIDLAIRFDVPLERTGFSGLQLTGPGVHDNAAPFPGAFSAGADERMPGLIVLVSTTRVGAGSCQNVANLFNLTGVTDRTPTSAEIWDTWIVGAPNFGVNTRSTTWVAVAADHDRDGIFDDAPAVVPDADGDGLCNAKDLQAFGLASGIEKATFFINP
jgi:hypothetical protein